MVKAPLWRDRCEGCGTPFGQSSYVTVGNYPGLEARAYGSEGALICRLVEEFGVCQTLHKATPDAVELSHRERRWVNLPLDR